MRVRTIQLAGRISLAACAILLVASCASSHSRVRTAESPVALTPPSPSSSPSPVPRPSPSPRTTVNAVTLPLRYDTGSATQVLTVVATSSDSTSAALQAWTKAGGSWARRGPAIHADIGNQGMTARAREGLDATPMGSFTLTEAFGRAGNPGTRMPYFTTDLSDYWVADPASPHYNTHYRCAHTCPFDTSAGENLYRVGYMYTHAVVMDYNRFPVRKGAGSAFFLHVTEGRATTGCIAIPKPDLVSIMRWIDPAAHPRILVGVAA